MRPVVLKRAGAVSVRRLVVCSFVALLSSSAVFASSAQAATYWTIRPPTLGTAPNGTPAPVWLGTASPYPYRVQLVVPSSGPSHTKQEWTLIPRGSSAYHIVHRETGWCLAAFQGVGYQVHLLQCSGQGYQLWQFYSTLGGTPRLVAGPSSSTTLYQIVNWANRSPKSCIEITPPFRAGLVSFLVRCPGASLNGRWRIGRFTEA